MNLLLNNSAHIFYLMLTSKLVRGFKEKLLRHRHILAIRENSTGDFITYTFNHPYNYNGSTSMSSRDHSVARRIFEHKNKLRAIKKLKPCWLQRWSYSMAIKANLAGPQISLAFRIWKLLDQPG